AVTEKKPHLIIMRVGNSAEKTQRRQLRQPAWQAGIHLRRQPAKMKSEFLQRLARVQPSHRLSVRGVQGTNAPVSLDVLEQLAETQQKGGGKAVVAIYEGDAFPCRKQNIFKRQIPMRGCFGNPAPIPRQQMCRASPHSFEQPRVFRSAT